MKNLLLFVGGGLLLTYIIKNKKPAVTQYDYLPPGSVEHDGEVYTEAPPLQQPHSNNHLNWTFGGSGT
jgi:hypothetical protein